MAVWNYENAAHLLRRAAFGGTPNEIEAFLARNTSVDDAVTELLSFKPSRKKPPGPKSTDFGNLQKEKAIFQPTATNPPAPSGPATAPNTPMTQLKRGMPIGDVSQLLGLGRQISQSTSEEGLKTQIFEYLPDDYRVQVTYVDGIVVRYSIESR